VVVPNIFMVFAGVEPNVTLSMIFKFPVVKVPVEGL
jgi:hypothetical protein